MDALRIWGGGGLRGEVAISGSKNATLPIQVAALLADGTSFLQGAPDLADVRTLNKILDHMGARVTQQQGEMCIDTTGIHTPEAPYELVRTMRASFLVLGPLLARFGRARVSLPGGCAIGARPVDQHLKALERMGACIEISHGYVEATAPQGLEGTEIVFDMPTVGGTENILLAASLARGTTVINNPAREPEVVDLACALQSMGADIEGAGTQRIVVRGANGNGPLKPYIHRVIPDRIEFGTFLVAGALVGEPLVVRGGIAEHQAALLDKLRDTGAGIDVQDGAIRVVRAAQPRAVDVKTAPYPGFPTDMQAQFLVLASLCSGASVIAETIFENRFMHVAELARLGANIRVEGAKAFVHGVPRLSGSTVMATDLRASACLVLAGLVAEGETVVRRIYHLDRGYEHIETKLRQVGARIERFAE